MLPYQRSTCLDQVQWNKFAKPSQSRDSITALECWKYQHVAHSKRDVNFRILPLADQTRKEGTLVCDVEEKLGKWLALEVSRLMFPSFCFLVARKRNQQLF